MTATQPYSFDWARAIARNREALLRIVALLFDIVGLEGDAIVDTLPRCTRSYVLRILRPAESAARRLILSASREIDVPLRAALPFGGESENRPTKANDSAFGGPNVFDGLAARSGVKRRKSRERGPLALPLVDPLKRFDLTPRRRYAKSFPRITCIGLSEPSPIPGNWIPAPDDLVSGNRLCGRLVALKRALDDIDGHARRLARWRARRDLGLLRARRHSPMRPGWPPGYLKRPRREVDEVLRECHSLAVYAQRLDTS